METRMYAVRDANGDAWSLGVRLNDLTIKGSANGLTWDATTGPYDVFAQVPGSDGFGFIGTSKVASFADKNVAPDMGNVLDGDTIRLTPPAPEPEPVIGNRQAQQGATA